ncbi:GNAT family N-acetyltransferase [uncultured Desulfuromonas sp.]|uniref:GNAT family N-acetyltransferase n=1 Tax=uncultured Desulfuromonas sp. TaxID=181013 RepID=UPI0026049FBD|nr:GNAT family N-acetyltransferase [uncultured Desulfuromonas sp.]
MQFRNLSEEDWQLFLRWATQEGWRVSFQEQRLFQNQWRPYFFALHTGGKLCGFVSAVAYKESGWIGNLLVPEEYRGLGYGSALFDYALSFLRKAQPKRIWLTASVTGQPIYQRRGFEVLDRIDRWVATGRGVALSAADLAVGELVDRDMYCWGESRSPLINALSDDGEICRCGKTLGLLQPGVSCWQLGPWLSEDKDVRDSRQLLQQAVDKTAAGKELLIDVLASAEIELVLRTCGFEKQGSNQLMVLSGETVVLNGVMALASLGSIG